MNSKLSVKKSKKRAPSESLAPPPMRHVSARTQPHSVAPHHIRSSSKIRYFFDFFAHPRFLRTLAHPPQTNALSHPPSHTSAKSLSWIVCRPIACGNTGSGYAIAPNGAIRSAYRPISPCGLNTGSLSPYFAIAQYGLRRALFRYRSIRALATLLPRMGQYAPHIALFRPVGSIRALVIPGLRSATPRAVFWRPFRALASSPRPINPARNAGVFPPRMP